MIPKFDPKELKVKGEYPGFIGRPSTPIYDFPVLPKEAYVAAIKRQPILQLTGAEWTTFAPQAYPDNVARAFIFEAVPLDPAKYGGKDMFGIEWEYVPVTGGSMVKPGNPLLSNANEWVEKVVWPDVDSWDFTESAKANKERLNDGRFHNFWILNGYFERLISFMDFEGAAIAMIDDDQKDAIKALFEKLTDLYIKIVDKFIEYYHAEGFNINDDWGSQIAPFFSPATAMEMCVPAMKRLTDHIHSRGCYVDLHSCGKIERQVPAMIAAGFDSWYGMKMNDTQMLYEKYADKIMIGVMPDQYDPETASEEEQRAAAAKFVEKFCQPGKAATVNQYGSAVLTPAYREELYRLSRIKFSEE